jgi:uncharacterized protein
VSLLAAPEMLVWFCAAIFLASLVYSSVGHGGASAYLALMALFVVTPDAMRPTALVLNICVTCLGGWRYLRSGQFDWVVFWPFAITAVPVAFLAGRVQLQPEIYQPILGSVLLLAGLRYLVLPELDAKKPQIKPSLIIAMPAGAMLGILAGLTGTGGGIFLSPLLVFMGWTTARTATGIAALFILVNSMAGLMGRLSSLPQLPEDLPILLGVVMLGALFGTQFNLKYFSTTLLLRVLGCVLVTAALPLLFGL